VTVVLDASAVLVLLLDEPGAETVAGVLAGAAVSAVNLAEVLSKLGDRGVDTVGLVDHLTAAGVEVHPLTERDAEVTAELRRIDPERVLSLGDRCCLALGRRLAAVVVTADRAWSDLQTGVELQQVR
jgi:ribonuclease VapC